MADGESIQLFSTWLADQRGGDLDVELAAAFHDLIADVRLLGKKGDLTLRVSVKDNGGNVVIVTDDYTVKAPRPDRRGSVWFTDDDQNLHRSDPHQSAFSLDAEEPTT